MLAEIREQHASAHAFVGELVGLRWFDVFLFETLVLLSAKDYQNVGQAFMLGDPSLKSLVEKGPVRVATDLGVDGTK